MGRDVDEKLLAILFEMLKNVEGYTMRAKEDSERIHTEKKWLVSAVVAICTVFALAFVAMTYIQYAFSY